MSTESFLANVTFFAPANNISFVLSETVCENKVTRRSLEISCHGRRQRYYIEMAK